MYFFEALKNYGRLKRSFDAAQDAALAYRKLEKAIAVSPEHAVAVAGKYILVHKETYMELLESKSVEDMTPTAASDYLMSLYRRCSSSGFSLSREDDRAINMAITALSLTEPEDFMPLEKLAEYSQHEDCVDENGMYDPNKPLRDKIEAMDKIRGPKGLTTQAVERARAEDAEKAEKKEKQEKTEKKVGFVS